METSLYKALKEFEGILNYLIQFGHCFNLTEAVVKQEQFIFSEISRVGPYSIGLSKWSEKGPNDPEASVVYIAYPKSVTTSAGTVISPIIIKEMWEVSNLPDRIVINQEPLPKQHWWHKQKYQRVEFEWLNTRSLERLLLKARERAERLHGVTMEQQERISAMVKEFKYRNDAIEATEAMLELNAG